MKKYLVFLLLGLIFLLPQPIFSQEDDEEASPSSEPAISTIKENVKKRIESVVKGQQTTGSAKAAFIGKLASVANDTLTIKTRDGIKLASTSDATVYVNLATSKTIKLEDIGIDDYISILGYLNESGVLDARRVILSTEPTTPTYSAFFGFITAVEADDDLVTLTSPQDSQLLDFTINKKSVLEYQSGTEKTVIDLDELATEIPALIIYKPAANANQNHLIVHLLVNQSPEDQPTATPSASPNDDLKKIIPEDLQ